MKKDLFRRLDVCMRVCVCVCMLYVHVYVWPEQGCYLHAKEANICIGAYIHTYIHTYMPFKDNICMRHARDRCFVCVHTHMHIYIVYSHTYIHTYIHTGGARILFARRSATDLERHHTYIHTYIHTYRRSKNLIYAQQISDRFGKT